MGNHVDSAMSTKSLVYPGLRTYRCFAAKRRFGPKPDLALIASSPGLKRPHELAAYSMNSRAIWRRRARGLSAPTAAT